VIAVKHIIHYLAGTHDLAICYNKAQYNCKDPSTCVPVGYCNADWGNSKPDHKLITGIVFYYSGALITWTVHQQKAVALSTMEAELTAISEATHTAIYLHQLLPALQVSVLLPIIIYNNNQGALKTLNASTPSFQGHMKHYKIKVAHLQDSAKKALVQFKYCSTDAMPADMLTKALGHIKFVDHQDQLKLTLPLSSEGRVKEAA
jgi:hypothetical protein